MASDIVKENFANEISIGYIYACWEDVVKLTNTDNYFK